MPLIPLASQSLPPSPKIEFPSPQNASLLSAAPPHRLDLLPGWALFCVGVDLRSRSEERDYVFSSRSKCIKNSWPFHPRSLQICQKRGVKDLLPPFEPPDLIRSQSLNATINGEQSATCSEANAPVDLVKTRYDVFASTSNTTLNAHMDQCLSVESNTEPVETVFLKPKVKPRKKRLMVDIYRTAHLYTLEDLDRRNGTNWAVELAMPTTDKEICTENRSPEVVPSDPRDDEREGDVYVDSNGIKIRILSKSSDASLLPRDENSSRKVAKHETGKGILMSKMCLKSKLCKNKMLKLPGKKNNKLKRFNTQVRACTDGDMHEHTTEEEEEEPTMHVQKPTESTSYCASETIRQWVGSKRSGLAKNCSRKLTDEASKESPTEAFSLQSPEEMATTSEANDDDKRSGSSRLLRSIPTWSSKTTPFSNVIPKVPRSSLGQGSVAGVSNGSNRVSSTKKFRKNRSQLRTGRREFSPSRSGLVHCFGQDHGPDHRHISKKFRVSNKETSKKVEKHTQEDTANNDFSYGSDLPALGQEEDQYDVAQQAASAQMNYESEEPETEMQYASASRSNPADCSNDMSTDSLSPENDETTDKVLAEGSSVAMVDQCSNEKSAHPSCSCTQYCCQ
ncbi:hypothetical protein GUJ93_ZPchr0004g40274 [Zizania palustris]|uniref:Uncharacterized protein n=1 Tax=Zizania palustris TaxID=103762 RepID=A0A8J5VNB9_ZIZPA|nr:hypothetical protein GUJ93_ZPchr0004g40274 [Zizania palustris]